MMTVSLIQSIKQRVQCRSQSQIGRGEAESVYIGAMQIYSFIFPFRFAKLNHKTYDFKIANNFLFMVNYFLFIDQVSFSYTISQQLKIRFIFKPMEIDCQMPLI